MVSTILLPEGVSQWVVIPLPHPRTNQATLFAVSQTTHQVYELLDISKFNSDEQFFLKNKTLSVRLGDSSFIMTTERKSLGVLDQNGKPMRSLLFNVNLGVKEANSEPSKLDATGEDGFAVEEPTFIIGTKFNLVYLLLAFFFQKFKYKDIDLNQVFTQRDEQSRMNSFEDLLEELYAYLKNSLADMNFTGSHEILPVRTVFRALFEICDFTDITGSYEKEIPKEKLDDLTAEDLSNFYFRLSIIKTLDFLKKHTEALQSVLMNNEQMSVMKHVLPNITSTASADPLSDTIKQLAVRKTALILIANYLNDNCVSFLETVIDYCNKQPKSDNETMSFFQFKDLDEYLSELKILKKKEALTRENLNEINELNSMNRSTAKSNNKAKKTANTRKPLKRKVEAGKGAMDMFFKRVNKG